MLGTLDLTASWLITAEPGGLDRLRRDRTPIDLLSAMIVLVVAIVYVTITKVSLF